MYRRYPIGGPAKKTKFIFLFNGVPDTGQSVIECSLFFSNFNPLLQSLKQQSIKKQCESIIYPTIQILLVHVLKNVLTKFFLIDTPRVPDTYSPFTLPKETSGWFSPHVVTEVRGFH